jgi:signal transduction histidine kinase
MLSLIHLEDNLLDRRLVAAQLAEDGFAFHITAVDTEEQFVKALQSCSVDLILADYNVPQFDGRASLASAQRTCPDIPFIVVSGALSAIAVVEILKAGATDFVLKDHLQRLNPAVKRALREAQDRSARRQAERDVREARDLAEAANRAKDHFLAVLSHELRTPLTPVLTAIQTMEADPNLAVEFREPVQMIRRNVQLEVKLIDDLLDLTRVSRGKLELNLQPTEAHESIRQVISICSSDLRGKRLSITTDLSAKQCTVRADPARLQQILWNLLKNAVKFTPEGGSISVTTRDDPAGQFEASVSDTGIGIDPEILPKVFDAFEQGGKGITRQFGGLGLGLAISRALAEQHGGRLFATSEGLGKGSTFFLRLPIVAVDAGASNTVLPQTKANRDALNDCRILLVDDHLDTARAMGRLLKRWGCDVQTADSVASALKAADALKFDVLISDIGLPDGSGLDLIRQLKARYPVKGIAVSGFGMEEDLTSSRSAGFSEHLVKPVDLGQLEVTLRKVLAAPPSST